MRSMDDRAGSSRAERTVWPAAVMRDLDGATVVLGAGARDQAGTFEAGEQARHVRRAVQQAVADLRARHRAAVWPRRMRSTLYCAVVTP